MRTIFLLIFATIGLIFAKKNLSRRYKDKKSLYLLPGNVVPTKYGITLHTYLEKCTNPPTPCHYDGKVAIDLHVIQATKTIILHSYKNINITIATIKTLVGAIPVTPSIGEDVTESAVVKRGKRHARRRRRKMKKHKKWGRRATTTEDPGWGEEIGDEDYQDTDEDIEIPDFEEVPWEKRRINNATTDWPDYDETSKGNGSNIGESTLEASSTEAATTVSSVLPKNSTQAINESSAESTTASNDQRTTTTSTEGPTTPEVDGEEVTIGKYDDGTEMLTLELPSEIPVGDYRLTIVFTAGHSVENEGFHVARNNLPDNKGYLLSTHFEPDMARRAFPCFDEPRLKAIVAVTVTISQALKNQGYHVLSNMPLELNDNPENVTQKTRKRKSSRRYKKKRRQDTLSDRVAFVFKPTPVPMSTYIIAIVVSDYVNTSAPNTFVSSYDNSTEKKPFQTWTPAGFLEDGYTLNNSQYLGPRILEHFTKKYGIGYALPKLDQISIPDFKMGAMENWGLITYRHEVLLPAVNSSISSQLNSITTIGHELAHQWFGNLVTVNWWTDLWLNEGFASFNEPILDEMQTESINGSSWEGTGRFISGTIQAQAFFEDSNLKSHAMSAPAYTSKELNDKFSAITYAKGGAVIRMWMHCLGEEVFFKGLKKYLKDNAFGTATPEKLMKAWNDTATGVYGSNFPFPVDIQTLFVDWYKKPGYPVIKAKRKGDKYVFTQERFFLLGENQGQNLESKDTADRYIPITISTEKEPNFTNTTPIAYFTKGKDEIVIDIPAKSQNAAWYILNNQMSGFYRVLYGEKNWKAIKSALKNSVKMKAIHVYNRAQILDDAFNFGMMENVPYMKLHEAFSLSTYLLNEQSYVVWRSFSRNIRLILLLLKGNDSQLYNAFYTFTLNMVHKTLNKLDRKEQESTETMLLREELTQLTMYLQLGGPGHKRAGKIEFFETRQHRWYRAKRLKRKDLNVLGIVQQKESLMKWVEGWCSKGNC